MSSRSNPTHERSARLRYSWLGHEHRTKIQDHDRELYDGRQTAPGKFTVRYRTLPYYIVWSLTVPYNSNPIRKRVICYDAARELGTLVSSSFRSHFFASDNLLTLLSIVSFIGYHLCQDSLNSLVSWHIFSLANSVGPIQNHSTSKVRITFTTWFP